MDPPAALLAHLNDLTASIGLDDQDLDDPLAALTAALRATATSYCGLQLTLVQDHWPVRLTAFTDGHDVQVGTSLRLPLPLVSPAVDPDSRVIFFAVAPGAFTDLAADLSYALGGIPVDLALPDIDGVDQRETSVDGQRQAIELDADLPPLTRTSGLTGLAELTVMNRAVGMLIAQGDDIQQAQHVLRRDAAAAAVDPHIHAARILRR